jgi:hypothetical protein
VVRSGARALALVASPLSKPSPGDLVGTECRGSDSCIRGGRPPAARRPPLVLGFGRNPGLLAWLYGFHISIAAGVESFAETNQIRIFCLCPLRKIDMRRIGRIRGCVCSC